MVFDFCSIPLYSVFRIAYVFDMDKKARDHAYYERNRETILARNKEWAKKNPAKREAARKRRFEKSPWPKSWESAIRRCRYPSLACFKYYGGKGVRMLLTKDEIKALWIRDNAAALKSPTLDRVDSAGHYEFRNCRFIEASENSQRAHQGKVNERTKEALEDWAKRLRAILAVG